MMMMMIREKRGIEKTEGEREERETGTLPILNFSGKLRVCYSFLKVTLYLSLIY
jgi:hypothetical protein